MMRCQRQPNLSLLDNMKWAKEGLRYDGNTTDELKKMAPKSNKSHIRI